MARNAYREVTMFVRELRAHDIVKLQFGAAHIEAVLTCAPERCRIQGNPSDNAFVLRYMTVDADFVPNSVSNTEYTCVIPDVANPALRAFVQSQEGN